MFNRIQRSIASMLSGLNRYLFLSLITVLIIVSISLSADVARATAPFFWDFINVDLALQTNGDLLVTETQKYTFTDHHTNQRYRYIQLDHIDQITDVEVLEGDVSLPVETRVEQDQFWLRWQHELNAPESHTFVIKYRAIGTVQTNGSTHQLDWKALFPDRAAAINHSTITLHVPDALSGQVLAVDTTGASTSKDQLDPTTFKFGLKRSLSPGEFLNIQLKFPANILDLSAQTNKAQTSTAQTSASVPSNSTPRSTPQNISGFMMGLLLFAGLMTVLVFVVWLMVGIRDRCPQCQKLTLSHSSEITQPSTRRTTGRKEIRHSCSNCGYHRTNVHVIPKKSSSSSSSSWSGSIGGCGSSSGGSSGYSSGGGSGCGSSGCGSSGCSSSGCGSSGCGGGG